MKRQTPTWHRRRGLILAVLVVSLATPAVGQTPVKPPKNKYTPEQDVQIGEKAAAEIRDSYPLIQNPEIQRYMTTLGGGSSRPRRPS